MVDLQAGTYLYPTKTGYSFLPQSKNHKQLGSSLEISLNVPKVIRNQATFNQMLPNPLSTNMKLPIQKSKGFGEINI